MTRKIISIVLAMCMIMSCFAISGISVSAATANDTVGSVAGGQTLYFQPNNNWKQDNARFAMYYFNNSTGSNGWEDLTAVANETDLYEATVPAGTWDGIVFVRMNPSNPTNSWDAKWNQTADLTVPSGKNKFTASGNAWDGDQGSWSTYTPATPDPESTTAAPEPVAETTVEPTPEDTITVYFTNGQYWDNVKVYYWGTGNDPQWPGVAMTYKETNDYSQDVYQATIPATATAIIFNGDGGQTVDITSGIVDGAQWYTTGETEDNKYKVGYVEPETPAPETTADPANDTTAPSDIHESGEDSIVYFKPGADWESDDAEFAICVYGWNHWVYEWVSMTYVGNGIYKSAIIPGHAVWASCTFGRFEKNTGRYTDQTAWNISAEVGYMAGKLYTLDANQWSGATGTWSDYVPVDTTTAPEPEETTVAPEPEETTLASEPFMYSTSPENPEGTITVYFTNAHYWNDVKVYYWGCDNAPDWPGVAMTYKETNDFGQGVYQATIPATATAIIFNGIGGQTVDITTGIEDGAWWYAADEMEDNKYKVARVAYEPEETTVAPEPEETTVAPEPEGTTVPAPSKYMYVSPGAMGSVTQYALWTWDDGQEGEFAYVQRFQYVGGLKDNACIVAFNKDGKNMTWNDVIAQSVDFKVQSGKYVQAINEFENNKYKVSISDSWATETTVAPEPEETTVAPEPEETTVEPTPEDTITVYFTDALNWGEANVYYWGTDTDPEWPGKAMTFYEDNVFAQKVYTATIPATVTGIIFNGNGNQTVDITTGIADGAQWYTIDEIEEGCYKVGYVEPVVEPTTEEPTEEPTTVEPTTVEPTTVEPTTEEPTEAPDPGDTTIKLVVPNNINSAYAWSDARLYYNNTGKTADNRYIDMTAADETYYMTELGTGISAIANAGAWKVFTVTVTPEQATAIDGALWVGFANSNNRNKTVSEKAKNILKAGVGEFDAAYSNAKASISDFDGYTFIIKDNNSTTSPYTSFIGYWTSDFTTVMMAAPMSDNSYSNWNAVSLSYGESGDSETAIPMFNTGSTTKVADIGDMSTLRTGRWYIYAVTLDAAQTADVNAATRVGFVKPGGNNRTAGSKNVLKAKTNVFDGNYNSTARTLEKLEGQVFVVKAKASASSIVIYNGEWQTEDVYTAGNADTVHIYFAAPKGADKTTAGWDTGVQLYYGTTTAYQNCDKVDMTKLNSTREVSIEGTGLTTLKSGAWDIYTIELDAEMISTIDASTTVGFIKTGSYNRTSALYTKNIAKAPTTEDGTYTKNKQSIETFDGKTFIINTCADTKNERTSYMGIWS